MSQPPPSSSLGGLKAPPPSPPLNSQNSNSSASIKKSSASGVSTPTHTSAPSVSADGMAVVQHQIAQHEKQFVDLHKSMNDIAQALIALKTAMNDKVSTDHSSASVDHSSASAEHKQAMHVHPVASSTVSNTLAHRAEVKDSVYDATKQLFNIADAKQQAITAYASAASNNTSSNTTLNSTMYDFNLNDSVSEYKNVGNSSQHTSSSLSLLSSSLMPSSEEASAPTVAELLQSGIKAQGVAKESKIKDVNKFIEVLSEQAKTIVKNPDGLISPADWLMYTMHLFKLLHEYGLAATLEYHYKLIKRVQSTGVKLNDEQSSMMIQIGIMSKYRMLNPSSTTLASQLIHSSGASGGKSGNGNKATRTTKFTGTPCPYHTKLLGRSANHTEADCRVKSNKQ
jgi:hypothetical protein